MSGASNSDNATGQQQDTSHEQLWGYSEGDVFGANCGIDR